MNPLDTMGSGSLDITEFSAAAAALVRGAQAIPAAFRDKPAPVDVRREAYLRFQNAVCHSSALANPLADVARVLRRPILFGGPWDPAARAHVALRDANEALGELLAAMAHVRLVGGPGAVDAMRTAADAVGDLYADLPTEFWRYKRAGQLEVFTERQKDVGDALIALTEACRVDLAYKRAPRRWVWQLWRPAKPKAPQRPEPPADSTG